MKMSGLRLGLALFAGSAMAAPVNLNCKPVGNQGAQACAYKIAGESSVSLYGFTHIAYALCSKALCTVDAANPKFANCSCSVYDTTGWQSASLSPNTYKQAHPIYKHKTLQTVYSNYSMANLTSFNTTAGFNCQFNQPMPWANCFGAKCSVSKQMVNGVATLTASCACPITQSTSFTSPGPNSQAQCTTNSNQVWSAVQPMTSTYGTDPILLLYKKLYPDAPPVSGS